MTGEGKNGQGESAGEGAALEGRENAYSQIVSKMVSTLCISYSSK